jgi:hypothetical protein
LYSRTVNVRAYVWSLLGVLEHVLGVALARGLLGALERDLLPSSRTSGS